MFPAARNPPFLTKKRAWTEQELMKHIAELDPDTFFSFATNHQQGKKMKRAEMLAASVNTNRDLFQGQKEGATATPDGVTKSAKDIIAAWKGNAYFVEDSETQEAMLTIESGLDSMEAARLDDISRSALNAEDK
jgi:hypothetical protein